MQARFPADVSCVLSLLFFIMIVVNHDNNNIGLSCFYQRVFYIKVNKCTCRYKEMYVLTPFQIIAIHFCREVQCVRFYVYRSDRKVYSRRRSYYRYFLNSPAMFVAFTSSCNGAPAFVL